MWGTLSGDEAWANSGDSHKNPYYAMHSILLAIP